MQEVRITKLGSNGQYSQTAKLLPEESEQDASFGQSVSVANGIIAVGAYYQKKMVAEILKIIAVRCIFTKPLMLERSI